MSTSAETTPSVHVLGVKGCGEAGAIAAPPAVIHSVLDALKSFGIEDFDMPATPNKIWEAIQKAKLIQN